MSSPPMNCATIEFVGCISIREPTKSQHVAKYVLRDDALPELNLNLSSCMPIMTRESRQGFSLDIKVAVDEKLLENPVIEC